MSRERAVAAAVEHVDSGDFLADLRRRVRYRTDSRRPGNPELRAYLEAEMVPALEALGASVRIEDDVPGGAGPVLIGSRHEGDALPTALVYGHADVVPGQDGAWREGLSPWELVVEGDRWYGRGTADNKGQHGVNLAALRHVLQARGRLGFNVTVLIETAEEVGSPGLRELCARRREELAADVLIASDGPRAGTDRPTLFLGSRGVADVTLASRRDGSHHSGNWGGLLRNPATTVAAAVSSIVDGRGRILVERLRSPAVPEPVRRVLADIELGGGPEDPTIDEGWGEPGVSPAERLLGGNTIEVLAMTAGTPEQPVGAIPSSARAHLQLRSVVGTPWRHLEPILRRHLDDRGLRDVQVNVQTATPATRLDPDNPWVTWALVSIERTTGIRPTLLPNLGGTLPNDAFADVLGLPTLWIPHSHPSCSQHAPDEHLLAGVAREGMQVMSGLFWDLGEPAGAPR